MPDRPKFFDDLAGVAGGALSALAGLREEAESMVRARVDEAIRKLDLVKREDFEAVQEMAANARAAQQALEARLAALEDRLASQSFASAASTASTASTGAASSAGFGTTASSGSAPPASGATPGNDEPGGPAPPQTPV